MDENIKSWSTESNGYIWTPAVVNLKNGIIYPVDKLETMKWAFAPLVKILKEEKENYKKPDGTYFEHRYDIENQKVFEQFREAVITAESEYKPEKYSK